MKKNKKLKLKKAVKFDLMFAIFAFIMTYFTLVLYLGKPASAIFAAGIALTFFIGATATRNQ